MKVLYLILITIVFVSCSDEPKPKPIDMAKMQDMLIEANKKSIQKESQQIDNYIKELNYQFVETGTGLRYYIYEKGTGEKAENQKMAVVDYEVYLLNGTLCYSTKEKGAEEFLIGKDNVESGLHEAINYMRIGDKAKVILPSHLAHGLAGDFKEIPPKSTVVYDVRLKALK